MSQLELELSHFLFLVFFDEVGKRKSSKIFEVCVQVIEKVFLSKLRFNFSSNLL